MQHFHHYVAMKSTEKKHSNRELLIIQSQPFFIEIYYTLVDGFFSAIEVNNDIMIERRYIRISGTIMIKNHAQNIENST